MGLTLPFCLYCTILPHHCQCFFIQFLRIYLVQFAENTSRPRGGSAGSRTGGRGTLGGSTPKPPGRSAGVRHRQIRRHKAGGRRGNHPHRQCLPPEIGAGTPTLALVKAGVQLLWPRPALWAESHPRPPAHFCLPFLRGKSRPPSAKPKTPYCFQVASSYQVFPVLAAPPQVVTIWARSAQLLYQNT